ncbi:MAG TPA: hypothetical protein VFO37_07590 [Chitinophagaceae bacterium]|nr:hypothetical protein [Chitinophagaceae bacterium]
MSRLLVTAATSQIENSEFNILVSVSSENDGKPVTGLGKRNFKIHYLGLGTLVPSDDEGPPHTSERTVTDVNEGPNGFYTISFGEEGNYGYNNIGIDNVKIKHIVFAVTVETYNPGRVALSSIPDDHGQTIAVGTLHD